MRLSFLAAFCGMVGLVAYAQEPITMVLEASDFWGTCPARVMAGGTESRANGIAVLHGWVDVAPFATGARFVSRSGSRLEWLADLKPEFSDCEGHMDIVSVTRQGCVVPWQGHRFLRVTFDNGQVRVRTSEPPRVEEPSDFQVSEPGLSEAGNPSFTVRLRGF